MKRVLYLSNYQVPYRVRFFRELAKHCDLTVGYLSRGQNTRDPQWARSESPGYRVVYSWEILRECIRPYGCIIVGCYTTPIQILAMGLRKLLGRPYLLNLDGEPFLRERTLKNQCKRFLISGAAAYLVAGAGAAKALEPFAGKKRITSYQFSSLSQAEIQTHQQTARNCQRDGRILVVGQYYPYKGLDVALEAARKDPQHTYVFVGMGRRTDLFLQEHWIPGNVQVIPFLQKEELENLYQSCGLLVLPSRQECWGLVVNEAASFGLPIVSTWGSGAAVEFLGEGYPQYLATPGNADSLLDCIQRFFASEDQQQYREFLLKKSRQYQIEENVHTHLRVILGE